MESGLELEMEYGMRIEQRGSRWYSVWSFETLRRFVLEHVLLHEIGHHVFHRDRAERGCATAGIDWRTSN
jgi:hypothetical protein